MWNIGLKELRKAVGMPAKELARQVGKSATYISRIESGGIANTSYDTVLSMAKVIADSELIKTGKVDLEKFDSDFAKLVLSCRFDYMKDIYNYAKKNKFVEEYSNIIRYLDEGDISTFNAISKYRKASRNFECAKEKMRNSILSNSNKKTLEVIFKELYNEGGYTLELEVNLSIEDILNGKFENYIDIVAEELNNKAEAINKYGVENVCSVIGDDYGKVSNQDREEEFEMPESEKLT